MHLIEMLEVNNFAKDAVRLVIPCHSSWQAPVILASVVLGVELLPVWVVVGPEDWLLASRGVGLARLVVDLGVVDGASVLSSRLVLILVVKHVVFDGLSKLPRHDRARWAVLREEKLAKADSCRDILLQTELDEVESVERWEARVSLALLSVDEVLTKLHSEGISHQAHLGVCRDTSTFIAVLLKVVVVQPLHVLFAALLGVRLRPLEPLVVAFLISLSLETLLLLIDHLAHLIKGLVEISQSLLSPVELLVIIDDHIQIYWLLNDITVLHCGTIAVESLRQLLCRVLTR